MCMYMLSGFRSGLALTRKHPDGKCDCGGSETVRHILIQCKNYSHQRRKRFKDQGAAGETVFTLRTLLNLDDWTLNVCTVLDYITKYK